MSSQDRSIWVCFIPTHDMLLFCVRPSHDNSGLADPSQGWNAHRQKRVRSDRTACLARQRCLPQTPPSIVWCLRNGFLDLWPQTRSKDLYVPQFFMGLGFKYNREGMISLDTKQDIGISNYLFCTLIPCSDRLRQLGKVAEPSSVLNCWYTSVPWPEYFPYFTML